MSEPEPADTVTDRERAAELSDLRGARPPAIGDAKDAQDMLTDAEARGDIPHD